MVRDATRIELNNLCVNKIMTFITHLPNSKKVIRTKWIFMVKRDHNSNTIKFKPCPVTKGFSQIRGIDDELTFSPTLSMDSIK